MMQSTRLASARSLEVLTGAACRSRASPDMVRMSERRVKCSALFSGEMLIATPTGGSQIVWRDLARAGMFRRNQASLREGMSRPRQLLSSRAPLLLMPSPEPMSGIPGQAQQRLLECASCSHHSTQRGWVQVGRK